MRLNSHNLQIISMKAFYTDFGSNFTLLATSNLYNTSKSHAYWNIYHWLCDKSRNQCHLLSPESRVFHRRASSAIISSFMLAYHNKQHSLIFNGFNSLGIINFFDVNELTNDLMAPYWQEIKKLSIHLSCDYSVSKRDALCKQFIPSYSKIYSKRFQLKMIRLKLYVVRF